MDAGFVVAALALLVALGGLVHNVLAIRHERRDRGEELELLRRQLAREEEDRDQQRRADVHAIRGGTSFSEGRAEHEFQLVNAGPATARDVRCWLQTEAGEPLGDPLPTRARILIAEQTATELIQAPRPQPDPLTLVVAWDDGAGTQTRRMFELNADPLSQRKPA